MTINKNEFLTSTQTAFHVGISKDTLLRWYSHDKEVGFPEDLPKLPKYDVVHEGSNFIRYWHKDDIEKIKAFKEALPRGRGGVMSTKD